MKNFFLSFYYFVVLMLPGIAGANCFMAVENNQVIQQEGECHSRHAPCSTFKIAIAAMGYNENLLIDEVHPEYPYQEKYNTSRSVCQTSLNPKTWIQHSCIWYSQAITQKMGMKTFQNYLSKFHYGNQDASGDPGKNNGLTNAWLCSSLEISPEEQIEFLKKLTAHQLPISLKAQEMTTHILFLEDLSSEWKLYGKTGSGFLLKEEGTLNRERPMGWFVGWVQSVHRTIIFAYYLEDDTPQDTYTGPRAKEIAKEKLKSILSIKQK